MARPPPTAGPSTRATTGTRQRPDRVEDAGDLTFVRHAVLAAPDGRQVGDVGAGGERTAGTAHHDHAEGAVRGQLEADVAELVVHRRS